MVIRINGQNEEVVGAKSLAELLFAKGLCPERIVVEHNRRIVPKEEWRGVTLQDSDSLEIVSFVAGG